MYVVACRHPGAGGTAKVFPVSAGNGKALIQLIGGPQGKRVYDLSGISPTLTSASGGFGGKSGLYFVDLCKGDPRLTDICRCLRARYDGHPTNRSAEGSGVFYGCRPILTPERPNRRQNGRMMKECGEPSFTITTVDRHGVALCECESCPKFLAVREATKQGYAEAHCGDSINLTFPDSKTRRGRVGHSIAQTLDTACNQGTPYAGCGRIRRLTPRECWRLQGFSDEMFDRAAAVNSDNQLYRQAGNSVTIPVVYAVGCRIVEAQTEFDKEDSV